jgi:hypothetical protein
MLLVAQGLARIGESDWFAGARCLYLSGACQHSFHTCEMNVDVP